MKSLASLSLLLLAGTSPAAAQEPPPGDGARGSSEPAAGEVRYDAVGYAARGDLSGVSAASTGLPAGSHAEITALDSGRTIVVAILGGSVAPGNVVMLSPGAASALGMTGDGFAVRVRKVVPTPQDIVQLRGGEAASFRAEAPPALLVALRKKVPATVAATPAAKTRPPAPRPTPLSAPVSPRRAPATPVAKTVTSGYVVQVAALSSAARAATVAKAIGGTVVAGPPVWRVRLGPYVDIAAATRARADAAREGYPGGQITRIP